MALCLRFLPIIPRRMDQYLSANTAVLETPPLVVARPRSLMRELMLLAAPVFAEQVLHMLVGLNDTYLANHVVRLNGSMSAEQIAAARDQMAAAAAAVGT